MIDATGRGVVDDDCCCCTTAAAEEEEEGGGDEGVEVVCGGLLALAAVLLDVAEGPAPVLFAAPTPAGAVPSDGVGAQEAASPVMKFLSPFPCKASGFPAGRVPTYAL